jgi:hypothetical protein
MKLATNGSANNRAHASIGLNLKPTILLLLSNKFGFTKSLGFMPMTSMAIAMTYVFS